MWSIDCDLQDEGQAGEAQKRGRGQRPQALHVGIRLLLLSQLFLLLLLPIRLVLLSVSLPFDPGPPSLR